jgi:superfamily I DNA/RNA helicase
MHDMDAINSLHGSSSFCTVTSHANATVDEVNDRIRKRSEGMQPWELHYHSTLNKILYHWLGKEVGGQVRVHWKKRAKFLDEPFDEHSIAEYVAEVDNRNDEKRALSRAFKAWDATKEKLPNHLANPAALPSECAYDWTLYKVCLEMERRLAAGELDLPPHDAPFRGALLIDEAQDLSPLHAVALGWYALDKHLSIRCYGDKNQAMDQDRQLPFLWEQGGEVEEFCGADPTKRRVPLNIGKLCEKVLPGRIPPAEEWCNTGQNKGRIIPVTTRSKREMIEVSRGFSIHESRYRVKQGFKFVAPGVKAGPKVESVQDLRDRGLPHVVISTPFMTKGRQAELVTIQRWLPHHQDDYLAGSLQARNRLYVSLTRTTDLTMIHAEMLDMIEQGKNYRWK